MPSRPDVRLRERIGQLRTRRAVARAGDIESRLTWIWGSPRSGSSWLLQLLAHPLPPHLYKSLGFGAPRADAKVPPEVIPVEELSFASHLAPWPGQIVDVYGKWLPGTVINYSEPRPTYLLAKEHEAAWRPAMRDLVLTRLRAAELRAAAALPRMTSKPALAIKETPTSHGADRVMALLPRSRALLLIRDPRDVVDSLMHAFGPGGFMSGQYDISYETPEERLEGVTWAAKLWAMSIDVSQAALAAHDPALARTVRYEDLLADTEGELTSLLAWMGLERAPEQIAEATAATSFSKVPADDVGKGKRSRSAEPGRWRENLSDAELTAVMDVVGDRLADLGYAA